MFNARSGGISCRRRTTRDGFYAQQRRHRVDFSDVRPAFINVNTLDDLQGIQEQS
jgi:molybdopterin-guanine dinucleotide biosynthesis protein A